MLPANIQKALEVFLDNELGPPRAKLVLLAVECSWQILHGFDIGPLDMNALSSLVAGIIRGEVEADRPGVDQGRILRLIKPDAGG